MGQVLQADSIADLNKDSSTELSLASSIITLGGQQYITDPITLDVTTSGANGIDTGSLTANTDYYVYAILNSGAPALIASLSGSAPTGFTVYKKIGAFFSDGSSDIFVTKIIDDGVKVGSVKQSMLGLTSFKQENGLGWVLMNGQSVAGTTYASLVAGTVPNANGRFLRTKDNGAGLNGDGDTAVGTTQGHQSNNIQDINSTANGGGTVTGTQTVPTTGAYSNYVQTGRSDGGNTYDFRLRHRNVETRPYNVTVNTYIKVN